jgi:hypothetical protein
MTTAAPAGDERAVEVPEDRSAVAVRLRGHTYVTLLRDGVPVATERGAGADVVFSAPPGAYTVQTDGQLERVASRTVEAVPWLLADLASLAAPERLVSAYLRLSSDAPDRHEVDGIAEVPADGQSFCTVTVSKVDLDGTPLTGGRHRDRIFLRATGGTIKDARGRRIRALSLRSGTASFRLVADATPRLVTVYALGREPTARAELQIEFV